MTKVLLVDDERGFAPKLRDRLDDIGCTVSWVTNADDCFKAVSEAPPALILLAATLEHVSGLNLCNGLKRDPELRRIPVVLMTRRPLAELTAHRELPTRANAYVKKSDDMHDILAEVQIVVARHERFERARQGPPPSSVQTTAQTIRGHSLPDAAPQDKRIDIPSLLPSAKPVPGETLEVFYEHPSEPAPPMDVEAMRTELHRLGNALLTERSAFKARIAALHADVALLERTAREQADHIAYLENHIAELTRSTQ